MVDVVINIDTDGANNKAGNGGCGIVINVLTEFGTNIELAWAQVSCRSTTNNQMELLGVIIGITYGIDLYDDANTLLDFFKEHNVDITEVNITSINITSDSEYCVKGFNQWINKWVANQWRNTSGDVKNQGLWKAVHKLKGTILKDKIPIKVSWVRGHNGSKYNEVVDIIAKDTYLSKHYDVLDFNETKFVDFVDRPDLLESINKKYEYKPLTNLGISLFDNFYVYAEDHEEFSKVIKDF